MRLCDYKKAEPHVDKLDAAVKAYRAQTQPMKELGDKLRLASPPIDGEWLPKSAVFALVDLIVVVFGHPKGNFKDCGKRIQSGMHIIQGCSPTDFATRVSITFICFDYGLIYCL